MRTENLTDLLRKLVAIGVLAIALAMFALGGFAHAYGNDRLAAVELEAQQAPSGYTYDAALYDADGNYPGVYKTAVQKNSATAEASPTIGIPSINDATLADCPTTESPAIICGTAVPFADQENARAFQPCSARVAPYSYFKYSIMDQQGTDGQTLKKLSGFDGTYVIVRIDVSDLWAGAPEGSYLHISQDKNNALLVAVGMDTIAGTAGIDGRDQWGNCSFSNLFAVTGADGTATGQQYQRKTASYKLSEMKDADGIDTATPYLDVILFSTASIVSGADAQKEGALTGDVELSLYIDQTADYDPATNWDPTSQDTTLADKCFKKFYDESKAPEGTQISRYTVKGSELHLETMVESSDGNLPGGDGTHATYWSLEKSLEHSYYDQAIDKDKADPNCGRTIKLMSEVPVIDSLALEGASATELKKRTLDVNSFDIQVANNSSPAEGEYTSGLMLKNAWLKIADLSNTTGAELAIGNNATMTIETGGKLIVDETCQLEIEWDGATAQTAEGTATTSTDVLNNGSLDLRAGGEVQNDGVITIEGTEGKPYQPDASGTAPESAKGHGELTICEGATLTNNGCFMPNGALYVQGTLVNNGKFNDDPIVSNDPDKGLFTYHRGIQCTWKDDVTQSNVIYGGIYVGMDKTWEKTYANAVLTNYGDILLCPGELVNEATIKNMPGGHIYSCATDKAIVPIEPDPNNPTVTTKEVFFDEPKCGSIYNWATIDNQGVIRPAQVTVSNNGSLGDIVVPGNYGDWFALIQSDVSKLTGTGYLYKHDLSRADVELVRNETIVDSAVYNGSAQWFDVWVAIGDTVYNSNKDFVVTYLDPNGATITEDQIVNAGTYQVVLKGAETFMRKVTKTFTVEPATITAATLSATSFTYNGKEQKPTVKSVKAGSLALAESDYTVTYSAASPKEAGKYTVTVTGKGNFTGTVTKTFTIKQATITAATLSATSFTYNGSVHKPTVKSVKAGSLALATSDYTVAYSAASPKAAGTYTVTVTGKGNFTGKATKSFTIKKAANTMKLSGKTATVKYSDVKGKAQTIKRANVITVSQAKGTLAYKLSSVSNSKFKNYFAVNSKTGDVTVKKGLAKGTYTIKVTVKAAGNSNFNALTKAVSFKVKVS